MTFLIVCIAFCKSTYIGLDIGSYYSKASTLEGDETPSIYQNSNMSPNTLSFLAFRSKPDFDWRKNKALLADEVGQLYLSFGENALRTIEARPWMGCGFWPLICNIVPEEASKYTKPFRMNSTAARINYEDSLTLYLKKYIDSINENTSNISEVCFVFPASFLIPQREVFEYSLKNFGIEKVRSIDDIDAVSYVYAIEHSDNFLKRPKSVLFIDIGGLSVKSYVVRFENSKNKTSSLNIPKAFRYSYVINRTEGGAHVTRRIVDYMQKKMGLKNVSDSEYHRLFRAAEKMKIELTSQESTFSIIENIGGIDHQFSMNRSDIEPLLLPLIETTAQVAKKASKNVKFDCIEIIGSTSKIEYVIKSLSKMLQHEILQSLPAEGTLAKGAGYSNSFLHNDSFVPVEIIEEKSVYSIDMLTLKGTYSICKKGEKCVDKVSVRNDAQVILINYAEDEIQKGQIVTGFGFYLTYIKKGEIKINLKSGPLRVLNAFSCDSKNHKSCKENKIEPLEPPKPLSEVFKMFMHPELLVDRLNETREELTNFTYHVLRQVEKNQTFRSFSNFTQRLEIIRCAEKHKKWLQDYSEKVTQPINFTLRLNELKKLVFPVYQRIRENNTLYDEIEKLIVTVQSFRYGLEVVDRSIIENGIFYDFEKMLNKSEKFLNDTIEMTFNEPGWKSYPVKANDVKKVNDDLKIQLNKLQSSAPPSFTGKEDFEKMPEFWDQLKNNQDGTGKNNEKMESYEDFVNSKKDPYSIDDL